MTKPGKFAQPFKGFEILERVGSGGMGTVFRARRKADGVIVALKVLRPSLSRNSRYVERLRREAEISMRLDHSGLVKGHGLGEEGGYHYLVMEFVEGRSLKALLKAWGRFPEEQVLDVGIQMGEALAYAHEHGVVHRDVKPGNILVDDDDRAKLTDLGLAKGESDPTLTHDGATVGTPQYMSPEQAQDPGNVDERSDLYSLGATMYHMAVGLPPFEGESVVQVISKLLHERADSAGSLNPEVSTGVNLILRRLLAKSPELRYQTARELLADLRRVQQGQPPSVDIKALARAEGRTSGLGVKARVGIAAATVAAIGFLIWLAVPGGGGRPPAPRGIDELRRAVNNASEGFRQRLGVIETFAPSESERVAVGLLQQDVLREFENEMQRFREGITPQELARWVDEHGLDARPEALDIWLQARLQSHAGFRGYTPSTLPRGPRVAYEELRDELRRKLGNEVDARAERLAKRVRRRFADTVLPRLEGLVARRDFAAAEALLASWSADPLSAAAAGRPVRDRLPPAKRNALLTELDRRIGRELAAVHAAARAAAQQWRGAIDAAVAQAKELIASNLTKRAAAALDEARSQLDGRPPWTSLSSEVVLDLGTLRNRIDAVRTEIEDTNRRLDFAALEECEDAVHRVLAHSLNVDEAERLVHSYTFVDPDARSASEALQRDLSLLRRAVDELLDRIAASDNQRWSLREEQIEGTVQSVTRTASPAVTLRVSGSERSVSLAELDRVALVRTLVPSPGDDDLRIGTGLFLFFGDQFVEAAVRLRNHRGVRYRAMCARRKAWLARLGERVETQAGRLLERIRGLLEDHGPAFRHLDVVASQLRHLEEDYGKTATVRSARDEMREIQELIELERHRRALLAKLDPRLAEAVDLTVYRDGDSYGARVTMPFGVEGFPAESLGWRKVAGGLAPPEAAGENPEAELEAVLSLTIAAIDPVEPFRLTVRFHIPGNGRALDLLSLGAFGSRVLLVQPPGEPARVVTDTGPVPQVLAKGLRTPNGTEPWFLVRGGRYSVTLDLEAARGVQRRVDVRVNPIGIGGGNRTVRASRPRPQLEVAAIGDIVIEEIRLEGKPSR